MNIIDNLTDDDKTLATAAVMETLSGEHTPSSKWLSLAGRLCGRKPDDVSIVDKPVISNDEQVEDSNSTCPIAVISDLDSTYCTIEVSFPVGAQPVFNVDADGHLVIDQSQAVLKVNATHMVIGYFEDEDSGDDSVLYADGATVDAVNANGGFEEASWKRGEWHDHNPISVKKFLTSLGVSKIENHTTRKLE